MAIGDVLRYSRRKDIENPGVDAWSPRVSTPLGMECWKLLPSPSARSAAIEALEEVIARSER